MRRGTKFCRSALLEAVNNHVIYFEGRPAAIAFEVGIVFASWVNALERDDPVWQCVAAAAACAYDVLLGALEGPYTEAMGLAYARGAWIGADRFDETHPSGLSPQFPLSTVRDL